MLSEHTEYESILNVFLCLMDRASYNMAIIIQQIQQNTFYLNLSTAQHVSGGI